MKIKNQVILPLSIILISIGTVSSVNAQNQTEPLTVNQRLEELEKLQREKDIALENLNKAIELNPEKMRKNAIDDEDWDVIRDSDEFQKLIEE
ncbi:MAG: hypothetical protein AAFV71_22510 [Cyanobacteria bacterium J06633_8]